MLKARRPYRKLHGRISTIPLSNTLRFCSDYFSLYEGETPLNLWHTLPDQADNSSSFDLGIFPWEVEAILVESFRNSPLFGTGILQDWNTFAGAINSYRQVCDNCWGDEHAKLIWHEMFRKAHLQFPWQEKISGRYFSRYFDIYSFLPIRRMIETKFGVPLTSLFRLVFGVYAHFSGDNRLLEIPIISEPIGIDGAKSLDILNSVATDIELCIRHANECTQLNVNYPYRRSLLTEQPLIRHETSTGSAAFSCPIPRHFLIRFLDGIYYDLVGDQEFANAYGRAFEAYVLSRCEQARTARLNVLPEAEYFIGRNRKDSVDIILSDDTADLFIECKARRVSKRAQVDLSTPQIIEDEMDKLVTSVSTTYRNIADGLAGRYAHWKPRELPKYLMMVFPKDWFNFAPTLQELVRNGIEAKIIEMGIDPQLSEDIPLIMASAESFEIFIAVAKERQLNEVLSGKVEGEHDRWELKSYLNEFFREEIVRHAPTIGAFDTAFEEIMDGIG